MALKKEDAKFRGMWSPRVGSPGGYAFKFLPTAPAQKPKAKGNVPPPEPVIDSGDVLFDAPKEAYASGALNIKDRYRNYRGYISAEGTCYNNKGHIIGYIDTTSWQVGSRDEEYLGYLRQDSVIENAAEEKMGDLDLGRATIKNTKGSTVAAIDGTGAVTGNSGSFLGEFEGFGYNSMRVIALYLVLLDPGMLNEIEG
eukprot:Phypoly_transcript_18562.p1 GENE.Phypoly_transcript_18562~~Phypoly_transcript_18562.p1  ORF type:complete len:198 (+),score=32.29 Phypoly_transcript_18562:94-687(+)